MSLSEDTIVAVATPPGRGGVGIVRVSGPKTAAVAESVLGRIPEPRYATFARFLGDGGETMDEGLALYFPGPNSYTGEAVLELHGHGGPVVMSSILNRILNLGARHAESGEFSKRAFLNGKLDLAQAEAVADLIDSGSKEAARAALRSLAGVFSERVRELTDALTDVRMYVEAAMDFPEEEIDFLADAALNKRLGELFELFDRLSEAAEQGRLLRDGMTVVIAGRPNAGKSSLLNRLAGEDAAIVTDIPGTTRDVVRVELSLDGMPLHVIDTAGLREAGDAVEAEGMRRTRREMERADRILLVVDASDGDEDPVTELLAELPDGLPVSVLRNKIDLTGEAPAIAAAGGRTEVKVSAATGSGIGELRRHLESCAGFHAGAGALTARRRHLDALKRARDHAEEGRRQLLEFKAGELMAEELRLAQQCLGEITGEVTSDDLLGRIFSSFCIGK